MITLEIDTTRLNERVTKFIKQSGISARTVIKKTGADLLRNIIRPEPYGKHPVLTGRARAGWYLSMKALGVRSSLDSGLRAPSQVTLGKSEGNYIDKLSGESTMYIMLINSVDYYIYLEYGHSKSAPYGMVRVSVRKMTYKFAKDLRSGILGSWKSGRTYSDPKDRFTRE